MTDYYAVLKKAISGLEHESGEVRRSVYDKARTALIGQLKAIQPPLTTSEISRQRLELEEAIRKVEREAAITAAGPVPARARAAAAVADALAVNPAVLAEAPEPEFQPEPEIYEPEPEPEAEAEYEDEPAPPPPPPPPPRQAARVPARPAQQAAPPPPPPPRQPAPTRVLPDATVPIHIDAVDEPPVDEDFQEPDLELPAEPVVKPFWPQAPGAQATASGRSAEFRQEPRVEPAPISRANPQWAPRVEPGDAPQRGRQAPPQQRREPPPPQPSPFRQEPAFGQAQPPAADRGFDPADDEAPRLDPAGDWQDPFEEAPTLDQGFADDARERDRGRRPAKKKRREEEAEARYFGEKPRRSRWPALIILILVGLVIGGVAALAWSQRSIVSDVVGGLIGSSDKGGSPAAPATVTDSAASSKNADRLGGAAPDEAPRAVRTVDAAPAPDDAMSPSPDAPAAQTDAAAPDAGAAPAADTAAPAEQTLPGLAPQSANDAAAPAGSTPAGDQALVAQKAILYEQPAGGASAVTALNGTVVWKFDANSSNGPEIQALADIPDRKMKVTINIRRNTDSSLPASHLVELIVDTPPDFPGGGIKSVPAFVMKPTEEARGQPLDGAPAKVAEGFFWIAFSGDAAPMAQNIALMRERNWIDIPLVYDNDQRAILTLEKGTPGQKAFEQALAAWGN